MLEAFFNKVREASPGARPEPTFVKRHVLSRDKDATFIHRTINANNWTVNDYRYPRSNCPPFRADVCCGQTRTDIYLIRTPSQDWVPPEGETPNPFDTHSRNVLDQLSLPLPLPPSPFDISTSLNFAFFPDNVVTPHRVTSAAATPPLIVTPLPTTDSLHAYYPTPDRH